MATYKKELIVGNYSLNRVKPRSQSKSKDKMSSFKVLKIHHKNVEFVEEILSNRKVKYVDVTDIYLGVTKVKVDNKSIVPDIPKTKSHLGIRVGGTLPKPSEENYKIKVISSSDPKKLMDELNALINRVKVKSIDYSTASVGRSIVFTAFIKYVVI